MLLSGLCLGGCGDGPDRTNEGFSGPGLGSGIVIETDGPLSGADTDGSTGGDETSAEDDDDQGGSKTSDGASTFDVPNAGDDSAGDPGDECAELIEGSSVGNQPADIIFVIDNSVSMGNEIALVQANMNQFSTQMAAASVDARVNLISGFTHNSDAGICIPPPLGNGLCPGDDHNPPAYFRVDNWIGSHNSLSRILQHYPEYSANLRPTAATHLVVVTDDESDVDAASFTAMFTALNPNFANFQFHTITNHKGNVYKALATQTGGLIGDLNLGQFQPVFDQLAADVISGASLACEYEIPPPGPGELFDPDEVNAEFSDGQGGVLEIGRVDDPAHCAGVADGWYYDNPDDPSQIILCAQTCDAIQGYVDAEIKMIFGCATIPAG